MKDVECRDLTPAGSRSTNSDSNPIVTTMRYFKISLLIFLFTTLTDFCIARTDTTTVEIPVYCRDYSLGYGIRYDVLNVSENFRTGLKLFSDIYYRGLAPDIKNKTLRNIMGFTWSFLGKWSSILWPHEFGHMIRTSQVGGRFSFVRLQFPGIIGKLEMPNNATFEDKTLAIIGGFEANYLMVRDVQFDYHQYNGLYNDELGIAFGNRIMYAFYTYVFSFQNPKEPETWNLEGGDPVNFTKLVWQNAGKEVFNPDSSINEGLLRFYNNAGLLSILWNLIDINLYQQAGAFFGEELKGKRPYFVGNEKFSWAYGTFFNASVLGAELYFHNYIKSDDNFYNVYFRYGFPFKNYGIGIYASDVNVLDKFKLGAQIDLWSQEFYGDGFAFYSNVSYKIFDKLNVFARFGYKQNGYLAGTTTRDGIFGFFGLNYNFKK